MLDLIVTNATIVTPTGRIRAQLAIADGRIAAIGQDLGAARALVDAGGALILPGLVDIHVHFREPGHIYKEDFASGTAAAAVGGVTTVLDMPNNAVPISTAALLQEKRALVEPKALVDFGLYGIILQEIGRAHV